MYTDLPMNNRAKQTSKLRSRNEEENEGYREKLYELLLLQLATYTLG